MCSVARPRGRGSTRIRVDGLRQVGAHATGWPAVACAHWEGSEDRGRPAAPGTSPGGNAGRIRFCPDHRLAASVIFEIVRQRTVEIRLAESWFVRLREGLY